MISVGLNCCIKTSFEFHAALLQLWIEKSGSVKAELIPARFPRIISMWKGLKTNKRIPDWLLSVEFWKDSGIVYWSGWTRRGERLFWVMLIKRRLRFQFRSWSLEKKFAYISLLNVKLNVAKMSKSNMLYRNMPNKCCSSPFKERQNFLSFVCKILVFSYYLLS